MIITVDLYHRTSTAAAERIRRTGHLASLENTGEIYCSDHRDENAAGYGRTVIILRVPARWIADGTARLDDEFELDDGTYEHHYAIPAGQLTRSHIVDTSIDEEGPDDARR